MIRLSVVVGVATDEELISGELLITSSEVGEGDGSRRGIIGIVPRVALDLTTILVVDTREATIVS